MRHFSRVLTACVLLAACSNDLFVTEVRQKDTWRQSPTDQVDILFIVDNSNSMEEEQLLLADGFDAFISNIEGANIDFHLGVVSTSFDPDDPLRGVLLGDPPILTRDTVGSDPVSSEPLDYVELFKRRAIVGLDGSPKEKGLEAAAWALSLNQTSSGGPNEGFVRPQANLLIVFVSDEDDCSDDRRLDGEENVACYNQRDQLVPVAEYLRTLEGIKGDIDRVQVAAIVGPADAELSCGDTTLPGLRYIELADLTAGLSSSICSGSEVWREFLFDLGLNAAGIISVFELSRGAQPETLEVFVDDVQIPEDAAEGWTYDVDSHLVTFHGDSVPARGTDIRAEYVVAPGS